MNKILPIIFSLFFCIVINAQQVGTSPVYDKNGNVGIGTAAPSTFGKLHVDGGNLLIRNNSSNPGFGNGTNIVITNNYTTEFSRHASLIFSNDENVFLPLCGISGIYDSWTPTNKSGMRLAFYTKNAAVENIPSEKMVITGSGNVGIGIATPNDKLEVNGSIKSSSIKTDQIRVDFPNVVFDWDNEWQNGFFDAYNIASSPEAASWFWGINLGHRSNNETIRYGGQILIKHSPNSPTMYFRSKGSDGKGAWAKIINSVGDQKIIGGLTVDGKINCEEMVVANIASNSINTNGTITANEIKIATNGQTADFVFEDDYSLKSLDEVKTFIDENKHLPDIPSAAQMEATGVNLAEMNKLLLQKIEELTLHAIINTIPLNRSFRL